MNIQTFPCDVFDQMVGERDLPDLLNRINFIIEHLFVGIKPKCEWKLYERHKRDDLDYTHSKIRIKFWGEAVKVC